MPDSRKLFLDDQRPAPLGWDLVKSFAEFTNYIETHGCPDVISFDHDLGFEHYPLAEQNPGEKIPYDSYKEKTGYHCAKWLTAYGHSPQKCIVHSMNVVGARNIAEHLLRHTQADVVLFPYRVPFLKL